MEGREITGSSAISLVRVPGWEQFSWLRHGFSTRQGGVSTVYGGLDLNLGCTTHDDEESVRESRRRFVEAVASDEQVPELICARQVHGALTRRVEAGERGLVNEEGRPLIEADGLMTGDRAILLGIQTADCVPVLVVDTRRRVVAAFHAGWRGTAAGIVERGIAEMQATFGSRVEDLSGAVGPSIRSCCYRIGEEVRTAFLSVPHSDEFFLEREGDLYFDLAAANRRQLLSAGLMPQSISLLAECTGCTLVNGRRKYFSHRMEQGFAGRMMAAIGTVG